MPEPVADQNPDLWRDAPAWRNLVLAAIALSSAVVAAPWLGTSSSDTATDVPACHGNTVPFSGLSGHGQVIGFLTSDEATKLLQRTQFASHMAINPDYLANVRSLVHLDGSPPEMRSVYLVPQGENVRIGDHVKVAGGHLDPSLPCHYIPNLISHIQ